MWENVNSRRLVYTSSVYWTKLLGGSIWTLNNFWHDQTVPIPSYRIFYMTCLAGSQIVGPQHSCYIFYFLIYLLSIDVKNFFGCLLKFSHISRGRTFEIQFNNSVGIGMHLLLLFLSFSLSLSFFQHFHNWIRWNYTHRTLSHVHSR